MPTGAARGPPWGRPAKTGRPLKRGAFLREFARNSPFEPRERAPAAARGCDPVQSDPMHLFRTVLFDLDGTLVDAFKTIHRGYCHTLPIFGRPAPTADEGRPTVGGGLENAMSHFLPPEKIAEACRVHVAYTETILTDDPVLYDGAAELAAALKARGSRVGVLTNKIGDHARRI